jgi:hypothetical protein
LKKTAVLTKNKTVKQLFLKVFDSYRSIHVVFFLTA